jgi:hypothetical protein
MKQRFGNWVVAGATLLAAGTAGAQQVSTTTEVKDGVTYQVTTRVVERALPTTEYQTREEKFYRPQISTQYQTHQQTYLSPTTQYQMVPRLAGRWNPFVQPYWVYDYVPVTRWEARPATVHVPLTKTDWVEETRRLQVPVTTYKTVKEEQITKVALGVAPATSPRTLAADASPTSIASQPTNNWRPNSIGGQQLTNDPPANSPYESSPPLGDRYKR